MKHLLRLGAVALTITALTGWAAAQASAALPEFLPGNAGEKLTGKGGPSTLEIPGEAPIVCKEHTLTGENTGTTKKTLLLILTIKGCTFFGFIGMKSLGDAEGTILIHAEVRLCFINKAKKEVGLAFEILPVHLEVFGKLLLWQGVQVGKITPLNVGTTKYIVTFAQKEGKPTPEGCEGEKAHLTVAINEGSPKEAGWAATEEIIYEKAQTLDA